MQYIIPFCYIHYIIRCESHNVYLSSPDGELPSIPTAVLSQNKNGQQTNVVVVNAENGGDYLWRVDCVEKDTQMVRIGDVWTFTVDVSS